MKGRKNEFGARSKYGQAFRDQVARDYESGDLSYSQVAEKYGLPSKDLPKWWVRCYRKNAEIEPVEVLPMTEKEKQEYKALRMENARLKKRLEDAELRALAFDTMIDVAEEQLGVEIRKKPGTKQSNG
jgi:transposase-like protein